MLLMSPHMREAVHQRLDKYILYGDQVGCAAQLGLPACCMAPAWGGPAALLAMGCSGRAASLPRGLWGPFLMSLPTSHSGPRDLWHTVSNPAWLLQV